MDDTTFESKLQELLTGLDGLTGTDLEKLKSAAQSSLDLHLGLKKSIKSLQDSLDNLRLAVKYMAFDLECCRFEKAALADQNLVLAEQNQELAEQNAHLLNENLYLREQLGEE